MNAIKTAKKFITENPFDESAKGLARLVLALELDGSFDVAELYRLDYDRFRLALQIIEQWRLDRYYAGKAKLFDLSVQMRELGAAPADSAPLNA